MMHQHVCGTEYAGDAQMRGVYLPKNATRARVLLTAAAELVRLHNAPCKSTACLAIVPLLRRSCTSRGELWQLADASACVLQGSAAAYNGLGMLHMEGQGVPVNFTRARQLFEVAAAADEPNSFFNLGLMHLGAPEARQLLQIASFPLSGCQV